MYWLFRPLVWCNRSRTIADSVLVNFNLIWRRRRRRRRSINTVSVSPSAVTAVTAGFAGGGGGGDVEQPHKKMSHLQTLRMIWVLPDAAILRQIAARYLLFHDQPVSKISWYFFVDVHGTRGLTLWLCIDVQLSGLKSKALGSDSIALKRGCEKGLKKGPKPSLL